MTAGETYVVCFVGVVLLLALGLWLETRLAVPEPEPAVLSDQITPETVAAFDLFRERRAGIDRTRAEIQALPELGDGASMSAEWWDDLTPEQMERYGAMIDSRVRLLGEFYGKAVEAVRASPDARAYVLGTSASGGAS